MAYLPQRVTKYGRREVDLMDVQEVRWHDGCDVWAKRGDSQE